MPTVKEATEIARKGTKLTMMRNNPFASKDSIRKEFRNFMDSLSEETFKNNVRHIITMMSFNAKRSSQFETADLEVDYYIEQFPRLEPYREEIKALVVEHRVDCILPL